MGDAGGSDTQYTFPYATKNLLWDANHFFNAQNKYSYTGKGRKLGDPMLQCDMCEQWFHLKEVSVVSMDDFVAFQRNYRFSCKVCTQGPEQFELQSNTWTSIILAAIYNLLLTDDGRRSRRAWLKVSDIIPWLQEHWGSLASGRDMEQLTENSAVQKCILYPQSAAAQQQQHSSSSSSSSSKHTLHHSHHSPPLPPSSTRRTRHSSPSAKTSRRCS